MTNTWKLITSISCMNVRKKFISTILGNNIACEIYYEIAEIFNSCFSEMGFALDEDLSTNDKNPQNYFPINNALSKFWKPIVPDECSKIIRALK